MNTAKTRFDALNRGAKVYAFDQIKGHCTAWVAMWLRSEGHGREFFTAGKNFNETKVHFPVKNESLIMFEQTNHAISKAIALQQIEEQDSSPNAVYDVRTMDVVNYIEEGLRPEKVPGSFPKKDQKSKRLFYYDKIIRKNMKELTATLKLCQKERSLGWIGFLGGTVGHSTGFNFIRDNQMRYFDPNVGAIVFDTFDPLQVWIDENLKNLGYDDYSAFAIRTFAFP